MAFRELDEPAESRASQAAANLVWSSADGGRVPLEIAAWIGAA